MKSNTRLEVGLLIAAAAWIGIPIWGSCGRAATRISTPRSHRNRAQSRGQPSAERDSLYGADGMATRWLPEVSSRR